MLDGPSVVHKRKPDLKFNAVSCQTSQQGTGRRNRLAQARRGFDVCGDQTGGAAGVISPLERMNERSTSKHPSLVYLGLVDCAKPVSGPGILRDRQTEKRQNPQEHDSC